MRQEVKDALDQATPQELSKVVAFAASKAGPDDRAKLVETASAALSTSEQESVAVAMYENATGGRFPQKSVDRRAVLQWGLVAITIVAIVAMIIGAVLVYGGKSTEFISVLATLVLSGLIGGIFGVTRASS